MDMREDYFAPYPIGKLILREEYPTIEKVVAHVENVWAGTNEPWYAIFTVPVCPPLSPTVKGRAKVWEHLHHKYEPTRKGDIVHAGEVPPLFGMHVLNGNPGGFKVWTL